MRFNPLDRYYRWQGYEHDHGKRMYYRSRSVCHGAKTKITAYLNGSPLKTDFRKLGDNQKQVVFLAVCTDCNKPCTQVWAFKQRR